MAEIDEAFFQAVCDAFEFSPAEREMVRKQAELDRAFWEAKQKEREAFSANIQTRQEMIERMLSETFAEKLARLLPEEVAREIKLVQVLREPMHMLTPEELEQGLR